MLREMYASCRTYEDAGSVTIDYRSDRHQTSTTGSFRTFFMRPSLLRFDGFGFSLLSTRTGVYENDPLHPGVHTFVGSAPQGESLEEQGIRALAGVSGGASYYVPSLLLNVPADARFRSLMIHIGGVKNPALLASERLVDHDCYVVRGQVGDEIVTLWIRQDTHLLQKLQRRNDEEVETITYEGACNISLDRNVFVLAR
jgi:hypothetical protein